jgi:hypothetical protein
MKKDTVEYRMMLENNQLKISTAKPLMGSLAGKYPVVLDGGRTIIYIDDKSKESEARQKNELRMENRFHYFSKKPKS